MHLGNARTALFSWLLARRLGGTFLLRIEDTDRERHQHEAEQAFIEDLRWLGLNWDEGPDTDGLAGPYRQSERSHIYVAIYGRLAEAGLTYPCFCSAETLAVQRKTQLAASKPPRYAGTCAILSDAQVSEKLAQGLTPTMRFRVPPRRQIYFDDIVHGTQRYNTDDIGDFIIRRADGTASFFFSNAVDDALMGVTHVIRGEDHLTNTPRQLLLLEALGYRPPAYGHVSLIVGSDGAPLSKRHGSASVEDLRARGVLPGAVVNMLARLGHYYESGHYMPLEALAQTFETRHLGTAPAHFDEHQLQHWQREAVLNADDTVLANWLRAVLPSHLDDTARAEFVHAVRGNVLYPADAETWAHVVYTDDMPVTEEALTALRAADKGYFVAAVTAAGEAGADYAAFITRLKALTPAKGKALFQPLRAALTGRLDGPELASLFALLGADRIRRRLEKPPC
jgi:glutamyl-tRNA synthetase